MRILVNPDQLRQVAQQVRRADGDLRGVGSRVNSIVSGLQAEVRARANVDSQAAAARRQAESLASRAEALARFLEDRADAFQRADEQGVVALAMQAFRTAVRASMGGPMGGDLSAILAQGGLLALSPAMGITQLLARARAGLALGASVEVGSYQSMTWGERFAALANLDEDIAALQGRIPAGVTLEQVQRERDDAQKHAANFWNRIIPTWPLRYDGDGVPWRVLADDYEDQLAGYEQQLADLQELSQLQQDRAVLDQLIQQGIPEDGPSKSLPYMAGCTVYVGERRDVDDFRSTGDAHTWNEGASRAGYETGEYPVKGSIMVFEPGVLSSDKTAGHVAYVENVVRTADGGYVVETSEANIRRVNGQAVYGDHTPVYHRQITLYPRDGRVYDEHGNAVGVEFIYDKL